MSRSRNPYAQIDKRYARIRGDKKFRLPPDERKPAPKRGPMNDQYDNNPGRTMPKRNPDDL